MFIQYADFISPRISLYFNGKLRHSSILSGIIALISGLTIFSISLIFLIQVFNKTSPNAFYFQKHVNDTGYYEIGEKDFFHFITFGKEHININLTKIKVIGVMVLPSVFFNSKEKEENFDYWEYEECLKYEQYSNISSKNLFYKYFNEIPKNSLCISNYYNHNNKKFYKLGESEFMAPYINHGASSQNSVNYGIFILRNYDLDNIYLKSLKYYTIHFIDTFVDVENYNIPFSQYFYNISNQISTNTFAINHLNFNPTFMKTDDGLFIESLKETKSYSFVSEAKNAYDSSASKRQIIGSFYFWIQNRAQIYQRSYHKIQDALGNIGGVSKIVTAIAYLINTIFNDYITLYDISGIFEYPSQKSTIVQTISSNKKYDATLGMSIIGAEISKTKFLQKHYKSISFKEVLLHKFKIKYQRHASFLSHIRSRTLSEEKIYKFDEMIGKINQLLLNNYSFQKKILVLNSLFWVIIISAPRILILTNKIKIILI